MQNIKFFVACKNSSQNFMIILFEFLARYFKEAFHVVAVLFLRFLLADDWKGGKGFELSVVQYPVAPVGLLTIVVWPLLCQRIIGSNVYVYGERRVSVLY